jgi:hypothetical protein
MSTYDDNEKYKANYTTVNCTAVTVNRGKIFFLIF